MAIAYRSKLIASIAVSAVFCGAGTLASYFAAGATPASTLGVLMGGIGFATLIVPQFALIQSRRIDALLVIIASSMAVAIVWMITLHELVAIIILLSYLTAICGVGWSLLRLRIPPVFAAAIAIILALAWLSWPMWATSLSARCVALIAPLNPIFNLNARVVNLGIWTQQPIMYRLTTLGQDVPFRLPTSIWPCAIFHGVIGLLLLIPARQTIGDEPSDR